MKQGKLSILLAVLLCLAMLITACEDAGAPDDATTTPNASLDNGAGTVDGESENYEEETLPEEVRHEAHNWFVLTDKNSPENLSDISRIEGEIISQDLSHNLVVIRDRDLDRYNNVITKLSVYNVLTGETLVKAEAESPLHCQVEEDEVTLDVIINYPVIRVLKSYYADGEPVFDVDFYLAKAEENNRIHSIQGADADLIPTIFQLEYLYNGLVKATLGDQTMWIDDGMNIIRTVPTITENGYAPNFHGEYRGCLYTLTTESVRVFNRQGLCSAEYLLEDLVDSVLSSFILNNGNVLIHKYTHVQDHEACDLAVEGNRFTVDSYVLDFDEGTLTEVDPGFIVTGLQSAYGDRNGGSGYFDMKLAVGRDNQAYIYRLANGNISAYPEYVVLSNELEVQYTLKNTTLGVDMSTLHVVDNSHYSAYVNAGVGAGCYVFDLDGNVVAYDVDGYLSGGYQMTGNGYFYNGVGELVFDANTEGYTVEYIYGHTVFLSKLNTATGGYEVFRRDLRTQKTVLLCDGLKTRMVDWGDGFYTTQDLDTAVYTVYAADGTPLLVSAARCNVSIYNDIYVIQTTFDGENILYVVKEAPANAN